MKELLAVGGHFYKAAMHIHTDISDGRESVEAMTKAYREQGYSIIAYTDHEVFVTHNDLSNEDFLAINAVELAVNDQAWSKGGWPYFPTYHLNFYAKRADIDYFSACTEQSIYVPRSHDYMTERMKKNVFEKDYTVESINRMIQAGIDDGFLVSYNHPVGSLQHYPDYINLNGLWGTECFNYGSTCSGRNETFEPIEDMLHIGKRIYPLAGDDSHVLSSVGHCFTMIQSPDLKYEHVMQALERGDFYSSTGPEIYSIAIENGILHIACSEAVELSVTTERRVSFRNTADKDHPLTEAEFDLNDYEQKSHLFEGHYEKAFFRVTVTDGDGKVAYSRPYFLTEVFGK